MNKQIFSVISIIRPGNCLITFISIFFAGILCTKNVYNWNSFFLLASAGAIVAAAGNIINDIFDIEIDKINRPERPLVIGIITAKTAKIVYFALIIISTLLPITVNLYAVLVVFFTNFMMFLYSYRFKGTPLIGNFIIAFFTGLAFIYGGIAGDSIKYSFMPAYFAFLINFIREIVKDCEDLKGDQINNVVTFPTKYGIKLAKIIIYVLILFLIISTYIPFYMGMYKIEYLVVVSSIVNVMLVYVFKILLLNNNFSKASKYLKLSMIFGIIAILIGQK